MYTALLAGSIQAELLAERPRLRQALAALVADSALGPLLGGGPRAAHLAHRAASWQRTWQPRLAQQLKAEQHADHSTHTAGSQPPSLLHQHQQAVACRQPPAAGQQAFQLSAPPPSQPQCEVVPLQQLAHPMQVRPLVRWTVQTPPKSRPDGASTA
jgi:hypothetical protein